MNWFIFFGALLGQPWLLAVGLVVRFWNLLFESKNVQKEMFSIIIIIALVLAFVFAMTKLLTEATAKQARPFFITTLSKGHPVAALPAGNGRKVSDILIQFVGEDGEHKTGTVAKLDVLRLEEDGKTKSVLKNPIELEWDNAEQSLVKYLPKTQQLEFTDKDKLLVHCEILEEGVSAIVTLSE